MDPIFVRTARIMGEEGVDFLSTKTVAVFGIGGVGSYAAEALVRVGIGPPRESELHSRGKACLFPSGR